MKTKKTPRSASVTEANQSGRLPPRNGRSKTESGVTSGKAQMAMSASRSSAQSLLDFLSPLKISLMTMAFRIMHVMNRDNWWLVHPDEVYQSVEIGHIEAYGYGFRSYEFSPPGASANDTRYQRLLLDANLTGMRSPIFPYFYTWAFFFSFQLGITSNPYLISRIAHVTITSLLPAAVYHYAKNLFHSRDTGIIAAIAAASSVHLNVFGTRCFLQSFLAPVTFAALSLVLRITEVESPFEGKEDSRNESSNIFHGNSKQSTSKRTSPQESDTSSSTREPSGETNCKLRHAISQKDRGKQIFVNGDTHCNSKRTDFVEPKLLVTNLIKECFEAGCLIGIASYVRPDVLLVHAVNLAILLPSGRRRCFILRCPIVLCGLLTSLSIGALIDRLYYQSLVVSPYKWIQANVLSDISTGVFGKMFPGFYVYNFILQDPLSSTLCVFFVFICIVLSSGRGLFIYSESKGKGEHSINSLNQCFRLLLGIAILILIFSLHGHKEMRFIHDAIVLLQIFISGAICLTAETTAVTFCAKRGNTKLVFITALLLLQRVQYPAPENNDDWVYQKSKDTHSINTCLEFVSQQKDVRGIFLDSSLFMTGGMTILHLDIPVLSLLLDGFFEFGFESRLNYSSFNPIFPIKDQGSLKLSTLARDHKTSGSYYSINSFTRSSNYVSYANAPAVVKIILENKHYNYLILRKDRRFLDIGFEEVFSAGNQRILRRTMDTPSEIQLSHISERLSVGTNATVLLHEGDVLANMGRCQEAVQRFEACLTIRPDVIGAYLPLHSCLLKLGRRKEASKVLATCFQMFTKEACTTARPLTRIN